MVDLVPEGSVDPVPIGQVLTNLIDNANCYVPSCTMITTAGLRG